MYLKQLCIVISFLLVNGSLFAQMSSSKSKYLVKEGIFFYYYKFEKLKYNIDEIVFIEHKVDRNISLESNLSKILKAKPRSTCILLGGTKYSQPYIFDNLQELSVDTSMLMTTENLKYAITEMPKIELVSPKFLMWMNRLVVRDVKITMSAGVFITKKDYVVHDILVLKKGLLRKWQVIHMNKKYKVKYVEQKKDEKYTVVSFLPIMLK